MIHQQGTSNVQIIGYGPEKVDKTDYDTKVGSISKITISPFSPTDADGQELELWFQYE